MVLELQRRFQGTPFSNRLKVIQGEVLKTELPRFDICVALSDIISSHIQTSLPSNKLQMRCDHVPKGICPARGQSLLPSICQHSAICQSLPPPQSRQEQFPPIAKNSILKEAWPSG